MKTYIDYKQTAIKWITETPSEWSISPLFTISSKNTLKNKEGIIDNVLSLSYGRIIRRNVANNKGLLPASFKIYQIVDSGDIVLRLTDLQNDKRSLRVGLVKEMGIITSAYICLKLNRVVNPEYIYYLLHSYDLKKVFYNFGSGVRQTMSFNDLKWMPIVIPSLDEQKLIASYLDYKTTLIDQLIEKNEKMIALLEEKRAAVINQAVTKGLNPTVKMKDSGIEWIGEIPEHWEVFRLKSQFESAANGFWGDVPDGENDIIVIRVADFNYNSLEIDDQNLTLRNVPESKIESRLLQGGDLIIEKSGGGEKTPVGRVVYFNKKYSAITSNFLARLRPKHQPNSKYLCYLMNDQYKKGVNERSIKQTTGIQNLDYSSYADERVQIPPTQEQISIASYLDQETSKIDTTILKITRQNELLKEYRQSLISHVVTGKVDVRDEPIPDKYKYHE